MGDVTNQPKLSHLSSTGQASMVDVSEKQPTARAACASATLCVKTVVLDAVFDGALPKGDVLAVARIAGVMAAKRTSEWIPLCHPLPLSFVRVDFERTSPDQLKIVCTTKTIAPTGVEMEALTGVSAAALTVYDMVKSADRAMVIGPIQLEEKSGGRSGVYQRGGS